jgi:hypothetical protein
LILYHSLSNSEEEKNTCIAVPASERYLTFLERKKMTFILMNAEKLRT